MNWNAAISYGCGVAIALVRRAVGLGTVADSPESPALEADPAGILLVGEPAIQPEPGTVLTGATIAASGRQIRFLPPSGRLDVNADWRNVADRIGSGVFTVASGRALFDAIAGLWYKGTTKTWISKSQWSGHGDGYARVRYDGQTIAILPWDREVVVTVPDGPVPFVQIDGVVNDASWVWAGEKVWYHFYRGRVQVNTGYSSIVSVPSAGGAPTVRPVIGVRLGNVSWALEKWQRDIINNMYAIVGESGYGQIAMKVQNWFAGFDPDRGLGKKTAEVLADLPLKKVS